MIRRNPLKALFYLNLLIVVLLVGYKAYLNLFAPRFESVHTIEVDQIHERLKDPERFSFAVVGNINNSVGIFEQKIIPRLNRSGIDFMVSAGNAVSGGGEDKYRALYGTLTHLAVPYLLTFGQQEYEEFGSYRFYQHFGPYFYSVRAGNSLLVFLDTTPKTSWRWQIRWLQELLDNNPSTHTFIFTGHPPHHTGQSLPFVEKDDYLQPEAFRQSLMKVIKAHKVDAVFSANLSLYSRQTIAGTDFIVTGGAGGLVLNNKTSFYHFVKVTVNGDQKTIELKRMDTAQNPLYKRLEGLWSFIYSLFYVGFLNFALLVSALAIVAIKLYSLVFVNRDYYPNYDLDPSPWLERPLRIAQFTNNYLPFIGGVPISIERLRRGLLALGNQILIVAPNYRGQPEDEQQVLRAPSLLALGEKREFRLANIFLSRIRRRVKAFRPDIIHVHHPFWLGSLGLYIGRRLRIPVVYTYHTRLEHYAHFVPLPGMLFRNLISHALIKRFANKCDGVIVPTYSAEEYLRMIGVKSDTFVQPTGIEYQRFQAVEEDDIQSLREKLGLRNERVLISVSRLSNEKNIDFMIDAIARLKASTDRPFRLLIIGDGHQRDRLQSRIDEQGLDQQVTLVGPVPPEDMATYYRLGDLFLFASKSETQGMVILEAMAAGLPVVAVRSSGIDDVVRQGYNGYKTPENLDQWRDRVKQLLDDEAQRQTLSTQARSFARDYSVEQFSRDVKAIYATLLASAAR